MSRSFNHMSPGFKQESALQITDGKIYLGFVKNNVDIQKMGRLEVYIPEMGTDPNDKSQWHIASYASPFAGATSVLNTKPGSQSEDGAQHSYGFWMVPPDLDNQVLVFFINGEATKCVWFACLYQQNMNHMVPGVASDVSFQEGDEKVLPPVVEYNKADDAISAEKPIRPRFNPLHEGLSAQGLYTDFERGPVSSSARRESPSKVFGFNTPRANSLYIDDAPDNEFIRIRTRSGTQVLVHETNGYVYINSGTGNSWIEVSDDGIDIYSKGSISMRTEQDFNIRADRNINLDAGGTVNVTAGQSINNYAAADINLKAANNLNEQATSINRKSSSAISDQSTTINSKATNINQQGTTINQKATTVNQTGSTINQKGGTINRDGQIKDNGGAAATASDAQDAQDAFQPKTIAHADVPHGIINTTSSRMPTHEPFALHPKSKSTTPPIGDIPGSVTGTGSGGSLGNGVGPGQSNTTVNAGQKVTQKTGDGSKQDVILDPNSKAKLISAGSKNASERVVAAIKRASDMTGVDFGYLMAMAEKESSFNPNAQAPTSSAKGLFQFTDSTWEGTRKKYPQYGIGPNDQFDPEKNALMGALLTKENQSTLQRYGISNPSPADLYLAHFAGPSGAAKLINAPDDANAAALIGDKAANANKSVFYANGQPKTVAQVTGTFSNFITPRAIAYQDFGSNTGSTT